MAIKMQLKLRIFTLWCDSHVYTNTLPESDTVMCVVYFVLIWCTYTVHTVETDFYSDFKTRKLSYGYINKSFYVNKYSE